MMRLFLFVFVCPLSLSGILCLVIVAFPWYLYLSSRKHAYIILTPLKPHIYIVKLGFTGVYIISAKHRLWVLVRATLPRRNGSNEYPQSMLLSRNMKNIRIFYLKVFILWW